MENARIEDAVCYDIINPMIITTNYQAFFLCNSVPKRYENRIKIHTREMMINGLEIYYSPFVLWIHSYDGSNGVVFHNLTSGGEEADKMAKLIQEAMVL